ncbi:unnamed protein product (macronuclear) [Paramecium tetraurelia]|uniref:Transmembrane protein n=1 Tax=Paramecium tetraurelia TaxID=5888 RepID=A0DU67_PARTE|nr:uncharacterized protein GSPATT00020255001 [Paramecium tetraurelia]CAK86584.1 unnamed protein product [Paramecium tetraurelia]|eukprot:XP_001453981.1 hypothetical protein (macronuclear) [Paramecium tetraurelia strain d4-2]
MVCRQSIQMKGKIVKKISAYFQNNQFIQFSLSHLGLQQRLFQLLNLLLKIFDLFLQQISSFHNFVYLELLIYWLEIKNLLLISIHKSLNQVSDKYFLSKMLILQPLFRNFIQSQQSLIKSFFSEVDFLITIFWYLNFLKLDQCNQIIQSVLNIHSIQHSDHELFNHFQNLIFQFLNLLSIFLLCYFILLLNFERFKQLFILSLNCNS